MPHFRFSGDPKARDAQFRANYTAAYGREYDPADPGSITLFRTAIDPGITFRLNGDPVEVADSAHISRLRANGHFEEVEPAELAANGGDRHRAGSDDGESGPDDADSGGGTPEPRKRGPGRPKGSKNKDVGEHSAAGPE